MTKFGLPPFWKKTQRCAKASLITNFDSRQKIQIWRRQYKIHKLVKVRVHTCTHGVSGNLRTNERDTVTIIKKLTFPHVCISLALRQPCTKQSIDPTSNVRFISCLQNRSWMIFWCFPAHLNVACTVSVIPCELNANASSVNGVGYRLGWQPVV